MEDSKRNYNCSDRNLYEILLSALDNYNQYQTDFFKFKAYYTAPFSATARAAVLAARSIPDAVAREASAEKLRLDVIDAADLCTKNFRSLKSYIKSAYSGSDLQNINYHEAGQAYYRESSTENWPSVGELNVAVINYITSHSLDLEANDNMPKEFLDTCTDDSTAFDNIYKAFKKAEQTGTQTVAKVKANNAIFRTIMDMMLDGQLIFEKRSETKKMFVFTELYDLIAPPVSGVKGLVMTEDFKIVPFAELIVERDGEPIEIITADEKGGYERRLASGPVKITAALPGMLPQTVTEIINLGSYKSFDFVLKAA